MKNVREEVIGAVKAQFPMHSGDVTEFTAARDVVGWDSFSHTNLMFELEDRLGVEIEIAETYKLADVGSLILFLGKAMQ